MHANRLNGLRKILTKRRLDGLILSKSENQLYISGFTGEGSVIVTENSIIVITDSRYTQQAKEESPHCEIMCSPIGVSRYEIAREVFESSNVDTIGVESHHLTVEGYDEIKSNFGGKHIVKVSDLVEEMRKVKDSSEIELIRQAQMFTDDAFAHILEFIKPGVTEKRLCNEIEFYMKSKGADQIAFDTIVASGPRGALPHAKPSDRQLKLGDFVTIDFGAKYQGYCSDMTRTVALGKPSKRQSKIYNTVLDAQKAALDYIKSGTLGKDVDKVARDLIIKEGYGDNFGHGLGHCVGLEIHENPRLSPKENAALAPGNVVTVEPGIYIEGFGGVRIEDMVLITETGYDNFTSSPKELMVL